ncbi:MAG: aspartyl protease family protein [Planctomycetaceae bacterium]
MRFVQRLGTIPHRTPSRPRLAGRSRKPRALWPATAGIERLEDRTLLVTTAVVPLDPALDQIGFQPAIVQAFDDPSTPEQENWIAFGIFDTGASVVTLSVNDGFFFEPPFPIKVPGGAVAEGIGGTLTGDVSQPVTVLIDGMDAASLEFEEILPGVLFPNFTFTLDGVIGVPGVQVFVGTLPDAGSPGSADLPTIAGTPMLYPTPTNPNGLAVLFEPEGEVLDLSDFAEGFLLPVPAVDFVQPGFQLTAGEQVSDAGTVSDPAATGTSFRGDAALFDIDDIYVGFTLRFASGVLAGEGRVVTGYDGATRTFTFADGFSGTPATGAAFEIVRFSSAPVEIDLEFVGAEFANYPNSGNDVTIAPNPVHNGISLSHDGVTITDQNFLFDTGAMLSTITTGMRDALGLDPNSPDGMLDIGGAGGTVASIPGYVLDEFTVPTSDGGTLTFTDVWVFVLDVSPEIGGIWGMNMFNPAAQFLYDPFDPDGTPSLQVSFFDDRIQQPPPELDGAEELALLGLPFAGAIGFGAPNLPGLQVGDSTSHATSIRLGYGPDLWVDASDIAGRTAPWQIQQIEITFETDVEIHADDLAVFSEVTGREYDYAAFDYDPVTHQAVWTLASVISQDRLTLTLDGDDASSDANVGVNSGGNYLAGGDVTSTLDVLFGDVDGNGLLDFNDLYASFVGIVSAYDPWKDVNGDGQVDFNDFYAVYSAIGRRLPANNGTSARAVFVETGSETDIEFPGRSLAAAGTIMRLEATPPVSVVTPAAEPPVLPPPSGRPSPEKTAGPPEDALRRAMSIATPASLETVFADDSFDDGLLLARDRLLAAGLL